MWAHFFQKIVLYLLVHNSEFLENLIKNCCIRPHFDVVYRLVLNGLINIFFTMGMLGHNFIRK